MGERAGHLKTIDSPGIRAEGDLLYGLRREVAQLLHREKIDFPGAQPVSFAKKHMDELRNEE
jgi:mRNA guanylyltransferase